MSLIKRTPVTVGRVLCPECWEAIKSNFIVRCKYQTKRECEIVEWVWNAGEE